MPVGHLILACLDNVRELHGYTIRELAEAASWSFPTSNPSIYPQLARLEKAGFVTSRAEVVAGRHRKVYAITDAGRQELARWLGDAEALPVGKGAWRDPMMFRLRLLDSGGLAGARTWLREGIAYWQEYLQAMEGLKLLDRMRPHATRQAGKYLLLASRFGMEQARQRLAFYRQILEEIDADLEAGGS